jgi:hypothetical protein
MATNDVILEIEQTTGKTEKRPVVPVPGYVLGFNEKTGRPEAVRIKIPKHTHPELEVKEIDGGTP